MSTLTRAITIDIEMRKKINKIKIMDQDGKILCSISLIYVI